MLPELPNSLSNQALYQTHGSYQETRSLPATFAGKVVIHGARGWFGSKGRVKLLSFIAPIANLFIPVALNSQSILHSCAASFYQGRQRPLPSVEESELSICVKGFPTFNSEGPFHTEERITSVCKRGPPIMSPTHLTPATEGSDNISYISLGSWWIEIILCGYILFAYSTLSNPANVCVFADRPP